MSSPTDRVAKIERSAQRLMRVLLCTNRGETPRGSAAYQCRERDRGKDSWAQQPQNGRREREREGEKERERDREKQTEPDRVKYTEGERANTRNH
jgi:hypothetical protein